MIEFTFLVSRMGLRRRSFGKAEFGMLNVELNTNKNWYALYVASRQEKASAELLMERGIEAYVPLVKTMRQWSDRKKMVELPLLNGYLFICIAPAQKEQALQTKGVVRFVRSEGKDAVIRQEEINRLKQLVELGYHLEAFGIRRRYKEGEKVKIVSGPLKNIEGFVVENKEGRFIDVLLESIGQSIRVKLPEELLIPA
jgi:transcription antitermination factor NusG